MHYRQSYHNIVSMAAAPTFFALALLLLAGAAHSLGNIECENLKKDSCAFAVSSSGKRCLLEKRVRRSGAEDYSCATSDIDAGKSRNYIETDECIKACGLDRTALGISSDSLLESRFAGKLCSSDCYAGCPNIVDLFFNLAAGEGVYLPKFCEAKGRRVRREMAEIKSSGYAAESPQYPGGVSLLEGPSLAPAPC